MEGPCSCGSHHARPRVSVLSRRCWGPAAGPVRPPCTTAAMGHTAVGAQGASDVRGRLREHSVCQTNPAEEGLPGLRSRAETHTRSSGSAASWRGARTGSIPFPEFIPLTVNTARHAHARHLAVLLRPVEASLCLNSRHSSTENSHSIKLFFLP